MSVVCFCVLLFLKHRMYVSKGKSVYKWKCIVEDDSVCRVINPSCQVSILVEFEINNLLRTKHYHKERNPSWTREEGLKIPKAREGTEMSRCSYLSCSSCLYLVFVSPETHVRLL